MNLAALHKEKRSIEKQMETLREDLAAVNRLIQRCQAQEPAKETSAPAPAASTPPKVAPALPRVRQTSFAIPRAVAEAVTQQGMVNNAIAAIGGNFTKNAVHAKVHELYPDSTMSEQDVASILWRMANRSHQLKVITPGGGGRASIYTRNQTAA